MTTIILDTIARALDALPLTQNQRAEVYAAWDAAPDEPVLMWPHPDAEEGAFDEYCESPAGRAWRRVRDIRLHRENGGRFTTCLDEASGYESAPTKTEILQALARADRMLTNERRAA